MIQSQKGQAFEQQFPSFEDRRPLGAERPSSKGGGFARIGLGEKGQAFEPFKMLIGAVMALTVLVIILSTVSYFDGLRLSVSKQRFFDGIQNAVRQPNGETLVVQDLQFQRGDAYSSSGIAKNAGLGNECITFSGADSATLDIEEGSAAFKENLLTNVFITCSANTSASCEVGCDISFEEAPKEPVPQAPLTAGGT